MGMELSGLNKSPIGKVINIALGPDDPFKSHTTEQAHETPSPNDNT